jgi:signal peptidase
MSRCARLSATLLLGVALLGLVAIGAGRAAGWSASPILTGSMAPTFRPGDLVLMRPVPVQELRTGDIAVFVPPNESSSYAHRVIGISGNPARPVIRTQGDANPAPDPWRAGLTSPTVPVVVTHLPYAGRLGVLLHGAQGHALLIAALGLALTATSVRLTLTTPTQPAIS